MNRVRGKSGSTFPLSFHALTRNISSWFIKTEYFRNEFLIWTQIISYCQMNYSWCWSYLLNFAFWLFDIGITVCTSVAINIKSWSTCTFQEKRYGAFYWSGCADVSWTNNHPTHISTRRPRCSWHKLTYGWYKHLVHSFSCTGPHLLLTDWRYDT